MAMQAWNEARWFDDHRASRFLRLREDGAYDYGITIFNKANRRRDNSVTLGAAPYADAEVLVHTAWVAFHNGDLPQVSA